jgi:hypothetical protein
MTLGTSRRSAVCLVLFAIQPLRLTDRSDLQTFVEMGKYTRKLANAEPFKVHTVTVYGSLCLVTQIPIVRQCSWRRSTLARM